MLTAGKLALAVVQKNAQAFAVHTAAVRDGGDDIEHAVHQSRVATRRLRAALRLFGEQLPAEACGLRDELQWIANQFARVRDLDVQLIRLRATSDELALNEPLEPYTAWLRAERERAMLPLCEALRSDRFAAFMLGLQETDQWPEPAADTAEDHERIRAAMKALRKASDNVHDPPAPAELHRVRIRAKRARYTFEFFEEHYGKVATRVREQLEAIQELLGGFQDTVVSRQRIEMAVDDGGAAWPTATLLALGRLQQYELDLADSARQCYPEVYEGAETAWRRFEASKLAMS